MINFEEEIAKRDARIAELEQQRQFWRGITKQLGYKCEQHEQQRGGAVLPEQKILDYGHSDAFVAGYNTCLDEVARLNPPGECVAVPRELLRCVVGADASMGANAFQLADGWKAMDELRALLAQQGKAVGDE